MRKRKRNREEKREETEGRGKSERGKKNDYNDMDKVNIQGKVPKVLRYLVIVNVSLCKISPIGYM